MNCYAALRLVEVLLELNVSTLPASYAPVNASICCSIPALSSN
jgi:hypothetical protein